jgi:hypothetical protein
LTDVEPSFREPKKASTIYILKLRLSFEFLPLIRRSSENTTNDGLEYVLVAYGNTDVPLRFAVLAGEIIHHLRSSLDHLVYALVIQNGGTPTNKNQFPICSTAENFAKECKRKKRIDGVSESAKRLIMAVQPYTTPTPGDTVLSILNKYDIDDKHKLLPVVTTVVKNSEEIRIGTNPEIATAVTRQNKTPTITGFGTPAPQKISKDGVEVFKIRLAEPAPELVATANIVPELVFEKCGSLEFSLVIKTLVVLFKGTQHTIETFAGEF